MSAPTAFAYRAVRRNGAVETGVVEAPSREAAIVQLGRRGAFAIEVTASTEPAGRKLRVSADELALGLRALATLLVAGIPLARALAALDDLVPPAWLPVLPDLRRHVEQGERLAEALDASPLPLPASVIGIVRAGEAGSGLAAAVERCAELLEARAATRAAIRSALAYPSMLAVAGSASVALLVGLVLPRFAELLADAGQALPPSTRLVLGAGATLRVALLPAALCLAASTIAWRIWVSRPDRLTRWHGLLLSAPLLGPFRRCAAAGHACAALAALLESGVPLAAALPHAARAAGDRAVQSRLLAARARIETGERVSSALDAEDALTPTVVRLVRLGEESGTLARMLAHAARIESNHALQRLHRAIRVLEPALILLFGGLVMMVAAALLQAMYGLRPSF